MEHAVKEPGTAIGGYTVIDTLGAGGSGKVYRVEDANGNLGALKLIDDPDDEQAVRRLRREVESLKALNHHAVPAVLDAEFDGEEKFVVYQFVEGQTLTAYVVDHGPLTGEELATFAETLADALEAVHKLGVVHRDVTPANVMMSDQGPMLIDFGLSQEVGDDRLTRTGLVSGTVGYVAPEVIDGGEPDEVADFWSWAAVVAFAGTGSGVFGHGKGALRRTLEGRAELPSIEGADELAAALSPRRDSRPSADIVIAALRGESSGETYEMYAPAARRETREERIERTRVIDPSDEERMARGMLPDVPSYKGGVIGTWTVVLALMTGVAPVLAFLAAVFLSVSGRAEHRRVASLAAARAKRGPRKGDAALATVGMPWHVLRGFVEVLPSALVAGAAAGGIGALGWWLVSTGRMVIADGASGVVWGHAISLVVAGAIGLATMWWGPWSASTRDGVQRGTYILSRTENARRGWVALAVIVAGALLVAMVLLAEPTWWPLPPLPTR